MLHLRLNSVTLTGSSVSRDAHDHLTLTQLQQPSKLTYYFNHNSPFLPHAGHTPFVGTETWCKGLCLRDWTGWVMRASWLSSCLLETKTCFRLKSEHTHHRKKNLRKHMETHKCIHSYLSQHIPLGSRCWRRPAFHSDCISFSLLSWQQLSLLLLLSGAGGTNSWSHEEGPRLNVVFTLKHLWRVVSVCRVFVYTCP